MAKSLMETLLRAIGVRHAPPPSMSDEQARVAARLRRIALRQKLLTIQTRVLDADTRDARRPR